MTPKHRRPTEPRDPLLDVEAEVDEQPTTTRRSAPPRRRRRIVGVWKIPPEQRDVAHSVITEQDTRDYLDIIAASDDPSIPLGARATYAVDLTDEEAERFRAASNCRYVEDDVRDSADAVPSDAVLSYMGALTDRPTWHGQDVLIAIADSGTTQAVRDVMGWTLVGRRNFAPTDPGEGVNTNHGCWVASCGVPAGGRILDLIIADDTGTTSRANAVAGWTWAIDRGAQLINFSYSGDLGSESSVYEDGIIYARERGAVLFCSTGNDGIYGMNTPANYARTYDNVIAVGSFNHVDDTRASSSNYHPRMSGVAPGVSVPALAPDGTETTVNGTSFATPHALQLCAMGMTGGSFTAMQVADALRRNLRATAEPAEDGGGAFDFDAALAALLDTTPSTDTAVTARAWTVEVGPAQVGQTIGTAQALTWTPSTQGDYTLRYTATHPGGLASDDVDVHVEPAAVVPVTPDPAGITLVGADAGTTATSTPAAALVTVLGLDGAAGLSAPAVAAALVADGQAAAAVVNLSPDAAVYTVAAGAADVLTVAVANADAGAATVAVAGGDPAPVVTGFAAPAEGGPAALDVSGAVASTPVEASATLGGVGAAAAPGVSASPAALTAAGFEPERALGSTAQTAAAVVLALDAAAVTSVAAPASTADLAVLGAQATSLAGQFATPDAAAAGLDGQAAAARVGASPGSGDFDAPAQPPATVPTVNAESAGLTVTAVSAAVEAQNTAQSEATSAAIEVLAGAATGEQTIVGLAVVAEHTITAVDPGSARVVGAAPTTAANTLEANGPGVMAATGVVFATVGAAGQPVAAALAATPAAATPAAAGHDPNVNTSGLSDATPDPAAVAVGSGDPSARAAAGADHGPVGFAALDGGPEVGANPSAGMVWVSGAQFTDVTDAAPSVGPAAPLTETTIAGHGATPNTKGGSAPSPDPAAAGLSAAAPAAGVGAATGAAVPTFTAQPTTSTVAPTVAAATTSVPGHNPPMAVTTRADAAAPDVEADGPGLGITGQREVTPSTADTVGFTAHTPAPSVSSRGLPGAAPLDGDGLDVTGTATTGPDAAAVGVAGQPTPTGVTPPASPPGGVTVTAPQASSTAEAVARPVPEAAGWTVAPPVLGFAVVAHIEAAVAGVSAADALGAVFRFIDAGAAAAALDGSAPGVRMGPGAVAALVVAAALDALAQVPILRGTVVEETPPRPSVEETSRAHGPEGAILQIIEWSRAHASAAEWERR